MDRSIAGDVENGAEGVDDSGAEDPAQSVGQKCREIPTDVERKCYKQ